MKWSFNLEKAPWWGGLFERMVQSVKRCLRKSIGSAKLSFDELYTALTEVEAIVNLRPISYLSSEDLEEPLTPSHLMIGHRVLSLPDGTTATTDIDDEDFVLSSEDLNTKAQRLTRALEDYWHRWREEYLLQLRERYAHTDSVDVPRAPIPGEIVLIHEENQPRTLWRLGRVKEIIEGSDGQIRGATLTVVTNGKQSILRRPISYLYPLQVDSQSNSPKNSNVEGTLADEYREANPSPEDTSADKPQEKARHIRPVRVATVKAQQRVNEWISALTDSI